MKQVTDSISIPLIVLFERRRKYNIPVHMSVHPELNQYLKNVLSSVRPLLEEGAVDRTVLAIHNKVSYLCSCVSM